LAQALQLLHCSTRKRKLVAAVAVHLANAPRLFLTPEQLAKRSSNSINLIAVSMDNGKSFTPVPSGQFIKA